LTQAHKHELCRLTDAQLSESGIFLCRKCDEFICDEKDQEKLEEHLQSHVPNRNKTNLELVTEQLYDSVSCVQANHWEEGLKFLKHTTFSQASFRQSIITKINWQLEDNVLHTFNSVLECCVEAHKQPKTLNAAIANDFDPTPIWILPFVFERLVLAPNPANPQDPDENTSIGSIINERLRLFKSGQIQELYNLSNEIKSHTPEYQASQPVDINKCAQNACDNNNFGSGHARLTQDTPVALIDDCNIDVCHNLHPPSLNLNLQYSSSRTTRGSAANKKQIEIHPTTIIDTINSLNRGKAPGNNVDSLDIYIKLAKSYQRAQKKKKKSPIKPTTLAQFFTIVANGQVTPKIKDLLQTTYMVALRKSETDPRKLRPLGIPSAIRRITAVAILQIYRSRFANNLLPFNYAFGVSGGVDFVASSVRLGVEKYIQNENDTVLPSRSLVSLDIKNMFNAVSRQKLRQIIAIEFPELSAFADLLYDSPGKTVIKRKDGTWEWIPVREGFSQGCPASPVFAGLVLNRILSKVFAEMKTQCIRNVRNKDYGDDGQGGVPLILGYVDDVNALIPCKDVLTFLTLFQKYGEPLGAVLNTEKTRIMTTTTGNSVCKRLLDSEDAKSREIGQSLQTAVDKYSRDKDAPKEVTDGLRVLGVPIGNQEYCDNFINKILQNAIKNSNAVMQGLESNQTILQLFKTCTAHKLTHLFAADVANSNDDDLPQNWNTWESNMTRGFDDMTSDFIGKLTRNESLPNHSLLISSMATRAGGLGIQNPTSSAIPTLILTTKRNIQYATEGVWIGDTMPVVPLPPAITALYSNWKTSSFRLFTLFRKYSPEICDICVKSTNTTGNTDKMDFFIYQSSLNTCRERIKMAAATRKKIMVEKELENDKASLDQLEDILEHKLSYSLVEMSRLQPNSRRKNEDFTIMLKRKLRLKLWPNDPQRICFCGKVMDEFGDHVLSCTRHCKTALSNKIRDGLCALLREICKTVKLISGNTMMDCERPRVIDKIPTIRPFDFSILFDHMLDESAWRSPLKMLGFDVVCVGSKPARITPTEAARKKEIKLRLRDGEKGKFCRKGKTCKETGITLTGDEIIKEIIDDDMALVPVAVSPHGHIGSLFERFLYGTDAMEMADYIDTRIHAEAADRLARSAKVPRAVLERADKIWRRDNPSLHYGGSYRAMTPSVYFDQQFGLVISSAISSHLIRAHNKNKTKKPVRCGVDKECKCEPSDLSAESQCTGGCSVSTPPSPQMTR
jgi:hypothetical protein